MARPKKVQPEPAQPKRPGRPKKVQPAHDPDIDRIRGTVRDAIAFVNADVEHAEKVGYLGRCLEELGIELGVVHRGG